ncbi:MAG TPA: UDP binding domain-containing protein, partial [Thermodesulfovibrionales bacterium]|nr:UDP binding domain-containing protein [Thermodesulfovibrionales bacterium]
RTLLKNGVSVVAYDPLALESAKSIFGNTIDFVPSAAQCLQQAGLCVVTLRSREFKEAVEGFIPVSPLAILDCWRIIDSARLDERIKYIPLWRYRNA